MYSIPPSSSNPPPNHKPMENILPSKQKPAHLNPMMKDQKEHEIFKNFFLNNEEYKMYMVNFNQQASAYFNRLMRGHKKAEQAFKESIDEN